MEKIKILLIFLIVVFLSSCNKDVDNVKLEVYVYDKVTDLPLQNVKLEIENAYYEGGDFDGYNFYENFENYTDKRGVFTIEFKKSAYIQMYVSKLGYHTKFRATEVYHDKQKFKFYLNKDNGSILN